MKSPFELKGQESVEEKTRHLPTYNLLDQSIDRDESGACALWSMWFLARNDEVATWVVLIAPKPCHEKRLFRKVSTKVVVEAASYNKYSWSAPSKWHHGCSLVSGMVNPGDQSLSIEYQALSLAFDFIELISIVTACTECRINLDQLRAEETSIAV